MPPVRQVIVQLLVGQRLAPIILGLDGKLDLLATEINRLITLKLKIDFLQLILGHLKGARVDYVFLVLGARAQGVGAQ